MVSFARYASSWFGLKRCTAGLPGTDARIRAAAVETVGGLVGKLSAPAATTAMRPRMMDIGILPFEARRCCVSPQTVVARQCRARDSRHSMLFVASVV